LKDVVQKELFGDVYEDENGKIRFKGGWVHPDEIGRIEWSTVTRNLARRVEVKGKYGSASCTLRAYTQSKTGHGSLSFAGTSIDLVWVDECPPDDLVGQLVTRTMTGNYGKGGRMRFTMTPELGATKLVTNFMEYRENTQHLIGPVTWAECPHLTPEIQEQILGAIPEHEREMRSKGVPYFGEGLVFPVPEERIKTEPFELHEIPWLRFIRAIDLGIDHPTAVAWLAYDAEIDRIYVLRTYSQSGDAAAVHAAAANSYLDFAPCVFPHDIDQREKGSGKTIRQYYYEAGLKNTLDFSNLDGSRYVEPGIQEMYDRMRTDRFKVFPQCTDFFREMRLYHRDKGKIVPLNDDVISAVRYGAVMITKYGVPYGGHRMGRKPRVKTSFS
jgi:phage terminase large subunit-like protein